MESVNQVALSHGMKMIALFREVTGNGEMQMQTMLTFLYVAYRHPSPVPMREIENTLGFTQTTNSRNVGYWAMSESAVEAAARKRARGLPEEGKAAIKKADGAAMFLVEEDPHYRKRKLITLTPKGVKFAAQLSQALAF